jgi:hypothetical protein
MFLMSFKVINMFVKQESGIEFNLFDTLASTRITRKPSVRCDQRSSRRQEAPDLEERCVHRRRVLGQRVLVLRQAAQLLRQLLGLVNVVKEQLMFVIVVVFLRGSVIPFRVGFATDR